jgi:hypothetical protein
MNRISVYKWVSMGVIGLLVAGLFLAAAPLMQVQAASSEAPAAGTETPPVDNGARGHPILEKVYQKLVQIHEKQAGAFEKAATINDKVNTLIAKFQAKGVDTSALSIALSTFNGKVTEAKAAYDQADSILNSHAGFDANGKVTDVEQAKATLKSAGESMKLQHQIMKSAVTDLRSTVRDFIKDHRPEKPADTTPSGDNI